LMRPSVVSASKSGAMSLSAKVMNNLPLMVQWARGVRRFEAR
jgi:hypothetical protein